MSESEQDLTSVVSDGSEANLVHKVVGSSLDDQAEGIIQGVYRKLNGSEALTGEEAIQAWIQLHTIHKLHLKLTGREKAGISASAKLGRELEIAPIRAARAEARTRFRHT